MFVLPTHSKPNVPTVVKTSYNHVFLLYHEQYYCFDPRLYCHGQNFHLLLQNNLQRFSQSGCSRNSYSGSEVPQSLIPHTAHKRFVCTVVLLLAL